MTYEIIQTHAIDIFKMRVLKKCKTERILKNTLDKIKNNFGEFLNGGVDMVSYANHFLYVKDENYKNLNLVKYVQEGILEFNERN